MKTVLNFYYMKNMLLWSSILLLLPVISCAEDNSITSNATPSSYTGKPVQKDYNIEPDGTYMFIQRDTCDLFMDVYDPAPGSDSLLCGKKKPTVIFAFGGSFARGRRDSDNYMPWFKSMSLNGYRVVSIDYRLGLKGVDKVGVGQVNELDHAIHIAVEDMVSATKYLLDNAETLGVDPDNIVISGSSAGAITALQTDFELSNRTQWAAPLPEGFRYAGVMAFAGAILSREGKLTYKTNPAPTLLLHGTEDSVVPYKQIKVFKLGFFGADKIAERFVKFGYPYQIFRYAGHNHEIATSMYETLEEQLLFLEGNVINKNGCCIDATVNNPAIPFEEWD